MRDYFYLIVGLISLVGAMVSTCTGTTRTRFRSGVHRANEPREFWGAVVMYYLAGVFLSDTSCINSLRLQTESNTTHENLTALACLYFTHSA